MSITSSDIQQQGFEHSLRGYDVEQVDVFLERIAQEVDTLIKQNAELKQQVVSAQEAAAATPDDSAELDETKKRLQQTDGRLKDAMTKVADLEKQLAEKSDMDSVISDAFISAQRSADALKEEARAEGERIYRESESKAREFIREALVEKQRIMDQTTALNGSYEDFREEYRSILAKFALEAEKAFSDVKVPDIDDKRVNAVLSDVAAASSKESSDFAEGATGSQPKVNPNIVPEVVIGSDKTAEKESSDDYEIGEID